MKIIYLLFILLYSHTGYVHAQKGNDSMQPHKQIHVKPIRYNFPPEQELYGKLKTYRTDSTVSRIHYMEFNSKANVSERVRQALLRLLKNEWTDAEKEIYIASRHKREYASFYQRNTQGIEKLIGDLNYDTVMLIVNKEVQQRFLQEVNNEINNRGVDPEVIKTVAWLDMKELIPFLKVKLLGNTNQYDREAVGLALARLGDTTYENYFSNYKNQVIRQSTNIDYQDWRSIYQKSFEELAYIATQKSVFHIYEWMDTIRRTAYIIACGQEPDNNTEFISTSLINKLRSFINNADFKKIAEKLYYNNPGKSEPIFLRSKPELIIDIRNWLIANKGRYIINREFFYNGY